MSATHGAHPSFFTAPPAGRRILAGFSHLQRIRKGATTSVWFPERLREPHKDRMEWAAVRQFDVLQEADNLQIYDMDVGDLRFTLDNITKMRAGGYRITVMTLGDYTHRREGDDLLRLDMKLQDEITRLIHFWYLNEASAQVTDNNLRDLEAGSWRVGHNLEHVALTLQTKRLYKPEKETLTERTFFEILDRLPARHILHDNGVGLQLPEATKDNLWTYIAKGENQLWRFHQAIGDFFAAMDPDRPRMSHMRGYGDHTLQGFAAQQHANVRALAA